MTEKTGEKRFEIVHKSRSRRERLVKCEAIDCTNKVKKGQELCAACQKKEDEYRRSFALQ